ncbi:Glyoxalase-like domain protein [Synechococcus sp. MIT S9509]|nr:MULTISPECIES: VOC family protein [unclassified Synechococcus]KZR87743.1 Glyoxalase-like domain protein [Synechococcus sp. MIT S9504]KZR93249.1 Glyoxalase-like domain protein [Synechococcus sp. MIT S9509]
MDHGGMDSDDIALSWVLASRRPEQLAKFYADLLGSIAEPGVAAHHWIVPLQAQGSLQIYTPSGKRPWPESGSALAPCLQRRAKADPLLELQSWLHHVIQLGGKSTEEPRLESFGAECWLEDPEGQRFLLLVLRSESAETTIG